MNGKPLALANEAFAEQKGWRRREELVDALPYIDGLEATEKEAVMRLIEEEVRSFHHFLLPTIRKLIHPSLCRPKVAKNSHLTI